jgi:hypothetical protein
MPTISTIVVIKSPEIKAESNCKALKKNGKAAPIAAAIILITNQLISIDYNL